MLLVGYSVRLPLRRSTRFRSAASLRVHRNSRSTTSAKIACVPRRLCPDGTTWEVGSSVSGRSRMLGDGFRQCGNSTREPTGSTGQSSERRAPRELERGSEIQRLTRSVGHRPWSHGSIIGVVSPAVRRRDRHPPRALRRLRRGDAA